MCSKSVFIQVTWLPEAVSPKNIYWWRSILSCVLWKDESGFCCETESMAAELVETGRSFKLISQVHFHTRLSAAFKADVCLTAQLDRKQNRKEKVQEGEGRGSTHTSLTGRGPISRRTKGRITGRRDRRSFGSLCVALANWKTARLKLAGRKVLQL